MGGTNARFAVVDLEDASLCDVVYYSVGEYEVFADVLTAFCTSVAAAGCWAQTPQSACLAVAGPVDGSVLKFTNSPWAIDANDIKAQLDDVPLHIINDFAAVGYATTTLGSGDCTQLGGGVGAFQPNPSRCWDPVPDWAYAPSYPVRVRTW